MERGGSIDLGIPGLGPATVIGEGGNAVVYRSRQESLDRDVAVKVLKRASDEGTRRRFGREQRAMGRMSQHDGIVTVYESGINGAGEPFLVMPLLPGSLQDELERRGRLPWSEAVDLIADVATTVHVAHEGGLVHRDLKPANLMLTESGRPLVADFGITRVVDAGVSMQSTAITLTPAFSPPEALAGDDAAPSTDVYALGATLYALIEGHPPFVDPSTSNSLLALAKRISEDPVPMITADAPGWVDDVIAATMAKDPSERTPSARELAALLRKNAATGANDTAHSGVSTGRPTGHHSASTIVSGGAAAERLPKPVEPAPTRSLRKLGIAAAGVAIIIAGVLVAVSRGGDGPEPEVATVSTPLSAPDVETPEQTTLDATVPDATTTAVAPAAVDLIPVDLDGPFVEVTAPAVFTEAGVSFPESEAGRIEVEFSPATSDDYVIWMRVQIPPGNPVNGNSLYVVEGANLARSDEFVWDFWENQVFPDPGVSEWDRVSRRGATGDVSQHRENPFRIAGRAGETMVVTVGGREPGVRLDRIWLTNDLAWRPPECAASIVCSSRTMATDDSDDG